ncbi:hypothetical protein ACT3N8_12550 [Psychrobacter aquimaris]
MQFPKSDPESLFASFAASEDEMSDIVKVVDKNTYKPTPDEKATIIYK